MIRENNKIDTHLLEMRDISKRFGATIALSGVGFDLKKNEVHAIIGENGAGKSTLVKILSGAIKPDSGKISIDNSVFVSDSPLASRKKGIAMIYQELNLAHQMTVEENIMLGREIHRFGFIRHKDKRKKIKQTLEMFSHPEISLDTPVHKLSVGARQVVEIIRAIVEETRILVMDEPTSSLSQEDSVRLFDIILRLKNRGISIIYISHFLEEIRKVADRYTVLRDGKNIRTGTMKNVSIEEIIKMMVGRDVTEMFPRMEHEVGDVVLDLEKLKGKKMKAEVELSLHRGEILGVAGLVGSGRTEMMKTIYGLDPIITGSVVIKEIRTNKGTPPDRIQQGLGFLSEDRQGEGLAVERSIIDNLTLSHYAPYSRMGFIKTGKRTRSAQEWIVEMKIKARDSSQKVNSLSGGNQQKVALARLLHQRADILLLDEPTKGIDVYSKAQIYLLIGKLAQDGKAVLFVSSYLPELLGVCDRIAVFHKGECVKVSPFELWDAQSIMTAATLGYKKPKN